MTTELKLEILSFKVLAEQWLDTKKAKIKASTRQKYLSVYNKHIDPIIGNDKLSEITSDRVNDILINLCENEEISSSLFNIVRYLLSSILKYGVQIGYIKNVGITVESAHQSKNTIQILNDKQMKLIVKKINNDINPAHLGIVISLYTGMRLGEVCALKRKNIDFENDIIHVHQTVQRLSDNYGKTSLIVDAPKSKSSYRDIPIIPYLLMIFKKYGVDKYSDEKYILNNRDIPYEPRTLQYGFSRFTQECELTELHYHCLRHTFATNCIRAGMDMKTLSEILGHSNVGITMNIYVHSDIEQKKQQMKLFENKLFEGIS